MFKQLLIVLPLLFGSLAAFPQQDSIVALKYMTAANGCIDRGQVDSARAFHRAALEVFHKSERLDWWLNSYISLSFALAEVLKRPFAAEDLLDEALKQKWREPQNLLEWEQVARVKLYKGHFYRSNILDYGSAGKYYEECYQLFVNKLGEKNYKIANYLYHQLGNIYSRSGDFARAENLLRRGIEYGINNNCPEVGHYGDLAIVYLDMGKNAEALEVCRQGLKVPKAPEKTLITTRLSESQALLNMGNKKEALAALNQVIPLVNRLEDEPERAYYLSGYYAMLAAIQESMGNTKAALENFQKTIRYEIISEGTSFCREVGKAHCELGDFYVRQKKTSEALLEYRLALQSVLKDFKPVDDIQNPSSALFYAENTIIEALLGKARAFRSLNQLEKALECYELIPIVETKLRATHAYESSKLLALDESRHRFDEAISIAWQLYESSNGKRQYADRAFRLTEQARGMLLLQSLSQAQANFKLPENIRRRETDLSTKLGWYDLQIKAEEAAGKEGDAARLVQLKKEQFDLTQENEKFKSELRRDFAEYAALSDEIHFLESGEVSALLRTGQAMFDYYLTDTDVFIFSFDETGRFLWRKAALPANFRESMVTFVEYLQKGDEEDKSGEKMFRSMAWELYQLLLEPEIQRMTPAVGSLIIVPDDALVFIPFEILLQKPAPEDKWTALPWLLEQYNTAYAYSATLLQMQQSISRKHRERQSTLSYTYGGFAPSYNQVGYKLTSTESLVNKVKRLLGGKTWCGINASEENFKNSAPDCRILLLAMHGLADAENPELSRLLFGDPISGNLENDNVLYAGELQIMQLQADLAILSACHSGFGKLRKGEGVFSLARAFARAGVPATVMSLWLLNENTAAPLVLSFVQYLQAGKSKDEALRLAKKDFLHDIKNANLSHPFFWAGVITSGDMCALDLPKSWSSWWWIGLGLLVLGISWYLIRRRKKQPEYFDIE